MDERKDPMIPGATPGAGSRPVAEAVRYEHTEVRVREGEGLHEASRGTGHGARTYDDRSGPDHGARDRYDTDRQGHFESDSGRIRAGIDYTRRDIDSTIDALQDKLSPERLMNRVMEYFQGAPGHGSKRLMEIARDNPVPAALVGAGVGWLIMEKAGVFDRRARRVEVGRGRDADWLAPGAVYYPPGVHPSSHEENTDRRADSGPGMMSRAASAMGSAVSGVRSAASGIAHTASGIAHTARDTYSGTRDTLAGARERMGEGASHLSEHARGVGSRARESASRYGHAARSGAAQARQKTAETYEDYPLAMAGLAIAGGLVMGLLLPPTRREDRLVGEVRDDLLDRAKDTGRDLYQSGQRVARAVSEAARDEAESEDLTPDTVIQSAKRIVGRAAEAAKDEAKHEGDRLKEKVGVQGSGSQSMGRQSSTGSTQSSGGSQSMGQGQQSQGQQGAACPPGQSGQNRPGNQNQRGSQGGQGGVGRA